METAGLQERKLNIIEQLIILNDEDVFQQVEDLINRALKRPDLPRFSVAEIKERAKQPIKILQRED